MKAGGGSRILVFGVALALLVAACGHKHARPPQTGTPQSVTIKAGNVFAVGTVLVNGGGWTGYSLLSLRGQKVVPCTSSACTKRWPAILLGTTKVPGGTQVTYKGQPLYAYSGDSTPGQAQGRGIASFGGVWHMLLPSGRPMPLLV